MKSYKKILGSASEYSLEIDGKFISMNERLSNYLENEVSKNFHVQYLCKSEKIKINERFIDKKSLDVNNVIVSNNTHTEDQLNEFRFFTINNFYKSYGDYYSVAEQNHFIEVSKVYFSGDVRSIFSYKNKKMVGCATIYKYKEHPFFKSPAWHIGYWGYDRHSLTCEEARFIKSSWAHFINENIISEKCPVVGIIDNFNEPVYELIKSWNFSIEALRCDLKK